MLLKKSLLVSLTACLFIACGGNVTPAGGVLNTIEKEQESLMLKSQKPIDFAILNTHQESKTLRGEQ